MATNYTLKPYSFNFRDMEFLTKQINFRPLFDVNGNALIAWNGTGAINDVNGNQIWNGVYEVDLNAPGIHNAAEAIAAYGQSYASYTASQGLRNVSGEFNNLYLENALWGANDTPFLQRTQVIFDQYVKPLAATDAHAFYALKFASSPNPAVADYTKTETSPPLANVVDYTPRMISQLTTTAGATFATEVGGTHLIKDANGFTQVADYGMLQTLGQKDAQHSINENDGSVNNEYFVGAINPGVSPVNGWFVLFGQFFDHGLDFVGKGGDGTKITINLSPDDPMYGVIDPSTGQPATKIVISRADVSGFDAAGNPQWNNHTSPYIDQSQTYGSDVQVTNILREWVGDPTWTATIPNPVPQGEVEDPQNPGTFIPDPDWTATIPNPVAQTFHAGAHMLDGLTSKVWTNAWGETTKATLPTLNELRAHLLETGRADITWEDVSNLRNRDANGDVVAGESGQALILDSNPRFDAVHLHDGDAAQDATVDAAINYLGTQVRPGDSFGMVSGVLTLTLATPLPAGPSIIPAGTYTGASALMQWVNFSNFAIMAPPAGEIANPAGNVHDAVSAILMASVGNHYIAGDGRVNENIGLTAVHHVWHEEHNFQVRNIQDAVTVEDARQERLDQSATYNHDLLHDWQVNTGTQDTAGNYVYADGSIAWNEDKLFNAAKITVEMEYQHTAVDQFARTITPNIAEFVGYNSGEQADVSLDFAQVAYRFGHSTLRESIDLIDPNGDITGAVMRVALERAFLTPELFAQKGAAAIALGMTHQQANEIDEFVTPALNQGLLGLPLDLAAINIARGRDLGVPTLNEFRKAIGLTEYVSWSDFGANMIHPDNLVNFIAAYSFDGNVALAQAIIDVDAGVVGSEATLVAQLVLVGETITEADAYDYALNFLQNTDPSIYGSDGFQHIDTWLGGLAEVHVTGGLLGETFDTVFADQISRLMNGDRFYYLYRLDQLQMGEGIINEQFKDIVERNTGAEHLNGSVFAYADKYYDLSENETANAKTEHKYGDVFVKLVAGKWVAAASTDVGAVNAIDPVVPVILTDPEGAGLGVYSTKGNSTAGNGTVVTVNGVQYIRDIRVEDSAATSGTTAINGGMNLDDTPNSGAESHEVIVATDNNDLIYAWGGDDTIYGEGGNDTLYGGNGIDRIYGGDGNDRIFGGDGGDLLDGGAGDDYVSGEQSAVAAAGLDQVIGGEGNDILHSGIGIDKLSGESGDDFIFGEGDTDAFTHGGDGNDIIDGGAGGDLLWGDDGDDLIIGGDDQDISAGLNGDDILRPGSFSQALGGGPDEVLGGDGKSDAGNDGKGFGFDLIDFSDHAASPQGVTITFSTQQNPAAAIDLTTPFPAWVGIEGVVASKSNDTINADATNNFGGSNWLFGGSGNDTITGGLGNDVIVGDGIRLDTLIGTYAGGYTNYLDGASARAADFVQPNGLLDNVGGGFDKHFTTMLSSATFKDLELGGSAVTRLWRNGVTGTDLADSVTVGDGGTAGAADVVKFTGNRAEYTVEKIIFDTLTKTVVNADGVNTVTAYKIIDSVVSRDGADLVVGVENFQFADVTLSALQVSNHAPVIAGGDTATVSFAENSPASVTTIVATDADVPAQTLVYSISGGADAGLFNIDSATGALTFASSPNFEAPTDAGADNVYDVVVEVSDGIATDTQALAVTVTNVDEARTGSVNIVNYTPRPTGNANVVTISAANTIADPDVPALVPSYQWQRSVNNGVTWTDIVGATNATLDNQSNITARVVSTYTDPFGTTTVVSPEMVRVGNGNNNILAANGGNDIVLGLGGNDTLTGNAGNDVVDGGTGNDTINATVNDGDDSYIGGAGTDTYNLSGTTAGATVDLTAGTATSAEIGNDTLTTIENVSGSSGNDTIKDGADASQLLGNGGNDTFILTADVASDDIRGGAGVDTVDYSALTANLSVILNGNGNVYVNGTGNGFGGLSNRDRISSIENFIGGSGNDIIGGDTLANELSGGNGDDSLRGGQGADVLTGGAGNDLFFYNNVNETTLVARDRITDFQAGDKIDLSGIDAMTGPGNGFTWLGANAFTTANANGGLHYYYDSINNLTIVEGSVDTNTTAEFQIELVGNVALTAADFEL